MSSTQKIKGSSSRLNCLQAFPLDGLPQLVLLRGEGLALRGQRRRINGRSRLLPLGPLAATARNGGGPRGAVVPRAVVECVVVAAACTGTVPWSRSFAANRRSTVRCLFQPLEHGTMQMHVTVMLGIAHLQSCTG